MKSDNSHVVLAFFAAWNAIDLPGILSFMADDCFYHNIPMAPMRGMKEIAPAITGFVAMSSAIEWITFEIAENEKGVVLTERLDRYKINGVWVEIPLMGVFTLRDGKISVWKDYFDLAGLQAQMAAAGASM